jgi:hypothetical protein
MKVSGNLARLGMMKRTQAGRGIEKQPTRQLSRSEKAK